MLNILTNPRGYLELNSHFDSVSFDLCLIGSLVSYVFTSDMIFAIGRKIFYRIGVGKAPAVVCD